MKDKNKEIIKTVGGMIVSIGVGGIVGNAINATTPGGLGLVKRVCIGVGSMVISAMATDKAIEYSNGKIDDIFNIFKGNDIIVEAKD